MTDMVNITIDGLPVHALVVHAVVVNERCIKGLSQGETAQRLAVGRVDRRDAAAHVLPTNQQHQHPVHTIAMRAFGRWPTDAAGGVDASSAGSGRFEKVWK